MTSGLVAEVGITQAAANPWSGVSLTCLANGLSQSIA
jgi:hypothetical protein